MSTLRIGPAGWSYPDWERIVYPSDRPRGFRPLAWIARLFNAVEVNTSFYRIPDARMTAGWVRQVPDGFRFAVKLTQNFTHQRGEFPPTADFEAFRAGVAPLRDARVLGPLLIQFPWSFRFDAENAQWLRRLAEHLPDFERVVEVRHNSWASDDGLATVRAAGAFCNIDQPALRDCLPPTAHVFGNRAATGPARMSLGDNPAGRAPAPAGQAGTPAPLDCFTSSMGTGRAGLAYVRLHGRNAGNWFAENIPGYERYNYLYSDAELREWVERIERMAPQAGEVYVIANNHYRGQAVANALELRAMLERRPVEVPADLLANYPRLAAIAAPPREPRLFD